MHGLHLNTEHLGSNWNADHVKNDAHSRGLHVKGNLRLSRAAGLQGIHPILEVKGGTHAGQVTSL